MNIDSKLLVCLFSDPNFLSVNILETLLSKNCTVIIVTDVIDLWKKRTSSIGAVSRFSFISIDNYKNLSNFSYAVFCGGFLEKKKVSSDFKKFIANKNFGTAKTIAVFPFETFSFKNNSRISISDNAAMVYMGDLMGPRIDLDSDLLLPSLINEMSGKRTLTLGVGEVFYPIFISDAAKTIVKWLLSFGPYGKDTFLLGHNVSSSDFWKQNLKSFPGLKVAYDTKIETRIVPKGFDTVVVNSNLNLCLNETYRWLINEKITPKTVSGLKTGSRALPKVKIHKPSKLRFMRPFILPALLILLFPLITTILSCGLVYLSYRQFLSENIGAAQNVALLAKTMFVIGKSESNILSYVPILGRLYKETSYISLTGETLTDLSINAIPLAENGRLILGGVLGSGIYDAENLSGGIKLNLDYIYQQISFFQVVTQEKSAAGLYSARQVLQLVDFDKLKTYSKEGGVLASNLASILGKDTNKNYLILFENNMELRPTGGFIGSYGVANFGGGKLNGLNINDIYSADGQLKGHIEPPAPIKNYLNEANWWFRDSNWNPDFPTSAERAEWFLNKEMDQQVDGVMAIDLQPIKDILAYTGPIFLPDYNLTITTNNLYEKTQEEAQANSFPGSRQKASFLTALARTLLSNVAKMNAKDRILVLKAFYEGLAERHFQIYLHDAPSAAAISKLGWDGALQSYSCGDGCYSDFFGDVEANVGVNKSNYFVKRKMDFRVKYDPKKISRTLTIGLENSANPALGLAGIYKSYMRIMIPADANLISVKSINGQSIKSLLPEITQERGRQEVGVFIEVTPQGTGNIVFEWENNIPKDMQINNYGLYIRKQAGVEADPLSVKFSGVGGLTSNPKFALTGEGQYSYNTNLDKDFFARLSWKQ